MASHLLDEERIFHTARRISDLEARQEYVDQVCGNDQSLRQRVASLLKVHESPDGFLQSHAGSPETAEFPVAREEPGQVIGRYKLREKLGEGGFGIVWAAEQSIPVRRRVALKVVKPGMDSRDVVARFEAERQALALMDHPNIAHVLDAGETPQGRPYFVMELIRGMQITDYCDENQLSIADRLRLFMDVCKAVQHAHQKGIIHRDIKPSNVLVTLNDNRPVPKVIDFGVAKAISQQLTDKTIYTRVHAAVGTLAYMAPEQAALSGQDIDTRADVYGLGVLLYELLTGGTPHDAAKLAVAAIDEAIRIIREEEPVRPSTRLSQLGATATAVSSKRGTDPVGLQTLVRGDLDWILMKALDKDRSRRYESASALARDIGRFLDSQPVEACPPSTAYRVRKFVRRNPGLVTTAALVLSTLVLGVAGTTFGLIQAERERWKLKSTLIQLKQVSLEHATTAAYSGNLDRATAAIRAAEMAGASNEELIFLRGTVEHFSGRHDKAVEYFDELLQIDPDNVPARVLRFIASVLIGHTHPLEAQAIRRLPLRTDDDRIFAAMLEVYYDHDAAMRMVNEVISNRPTPLALDVIAQHKILHASRTMQMSDAYRAIDTVEQLQILMGQNGHSTWLELYAHNVAFQIAVTAGDTKAAKQLLETGAQVSRRLARYPETSIGIFSRYLHSVHSGDLDEQWRLLQRVGSSPNGYIEIAANRFAHASTPQAALEDLETVARLKDALTYRVAQALLWAQLPNSRQQVLGIYDELAEASPAGVLSELAPFGLAFVGDETLLRNFAAKLPRLAIENTYRGHYNDPTLSIAYLLDELDESELIDGTSKHSHQRCTALAHIGVMELARNNREHALAAFKQCIETGKYNNPNYTWARVVRDRMVRDPNWPPRRDQETVPSHRYEDTHPARSHGS